MLLALPSVAFAFHPPNSSLGVGAGFVPGGPAIGVRGEAWFADELSVEIGVTSDPSFDGLGADLALRWRPDLLCGACDRRALVTFGIGLAGFVVPDLKLDGPWTTTVGPDLAGTFVYWFGPNYGLAIGFRGGAGAQFDGGEVGEAVPAGWGLASVGLAF